MATRPCYTIHFLHIVLSYIFLYDLVLSYTFISIVLSYCTSLYFHFSVYDLLHSMYYYLYLFLDCVYMPCLISYSGYTPMLYFFILHFHTCTIVYFHIICFYLVLFIYCHPILFIYFIYICTFLFYHILYAFVYFLYFSCIGLKSILSYHIFIFRIT